MMIFKNGFFFGEKLKKNPKKYPNNPNNPDNSQIARVGVVI